MIRGSAHIGVVVKDVEQAAKLYRSIFGVEVSPTIDAEDMKVSLIKIGNSEIELMEPTDSDGPTGKFLAKRGEGIHHICLEVDDIKGALQHLSQEGIELVDKTPRQGLEGKIAFLHPRMTNGVLLELQQTD